MYAQTQGFSHKKFMLHFSRYSNSVLNRISFAAVMYIDLTVPSMKDKTVKNDLLGDYI